LRRHYGARLTGFPSSDKSWLEEDDSYLGLRLVCFSSCSEQDSEIHWNAASAQCINYHRYLFG
jgi:hypothetical protein